MPPVVDLSYMSRLVGVLLVVQGRHAVPDVVGQSFYGIDVRVPREHEARRTTDEGVEEPSQSA